MSLNVKLTWRGNELAAALLQSAQAAGDKTIEKMVDLAKVFVPVDTGLLQSSIKQFDSAPHLWSFGSDVRYAIWVEIGSQGRPPKRYIAKAAEQAKHYFFVYMKSELQSRGW